jgi:hypothetical protein
LGPRLNSPGTSLTSSCSTGQNTAAVQTTPPAVQPVSDAAKHGSSIIHDQILPTKTSEYHAVDTEVQSKTQQHTKHHTKHHSCRKGKGQTVRNKKCMRLAPPVRLQYCTAAAAILPTARHTCRFARQKHSVTKTLHVEVQPRSGCTRQ